MRVHKALVFALVTLLAGGVTATYDARRAPRNFYAVTWDWNFEKRSEADIQRHWDLMASSGVESTRVVFSWAAAQPRHGPIRFEQTDRVVARAAWRGIRLLPVVYETPNWAKLDESRRNSPPRYAGGRRLRTCAGVALRAAWELLGRAPRGPAAADPRLANLERARAPVLQDVPPDWTAAWPSGYVKLLKAARRAIKSRDRRAKVVVAGLSGEGWKHLRRLYRARARKLFDVVAIHPYSPRVKSTLQAVRLTRRVMAKYRDARKPLWITELGWSAGRGLFDLDSERDAGLRRLADHGLRSGQAAPEQLRRPPPAAEEQALPREPPLLVHLDVVLRRRGGRDLGVRRPGQRRSPALRAHARCAHTRPVPGAAGLRQGADRRLPLTATIALAVRELRAALPGEAGGPLASRRPEPLAQRGSKRRASTPPRTRRRRPGPPAGPRRRASPAGHRGQRRRPAHRRPWPRCRGGRSPRRARASPGPALGVETGQVVVADVAEERPGTSSSACM